MSEETTSKKKWYASKTLWVSLVTGLIGWVPGAKEFLVANPEIVTTTIGVVGAVLRFVTKDKIVIG